MSERLPFWISRLVGWLHDRLRSSHLRFDHMDDPCGQWWYGGSQS